MRLNRLLVLKQAKLPFLIVSQFDHMTSSIVDDIYLSKSARTSIREIYFFNLLVFHPHAGSNPNPFS